MPDLAAASLATQLGMLLSVTALVPLISSKPCRPNSCLLVILIVLSHPFSTADIHYRSAYDTCCTFHIEQCEQVQFCHLAEPFHVLLQHGQDWSP